jgi:hypothetical protein
MSKMEIDSYGNKIWLNAYGYFHRLDGPAIEWTDGRKSWHVGGNQNISLYELLDGVKASAYNIWRINDVRYTNFKEFQAAGRLTDEAMMVLRLKYGEIV